MNCIDKLLSGVTKKVCPQGILRGFTGNIVLRDWRGWNQDNPKQEYKTEVKLECNKYSIKPMSDTFLREDNISLFDHSLTANLENISNDALQVLTGIQQIPVIVLVELTDLSYIELFPRNGGKLSFKNDFAGQSKDKCQLTIKSFFVEQHEDSPPINYATELSLINLTPSDDSIDVPIDTSFSMEFDMTVVASEIPHTIVLREAFSKAVIQNFVVSKATSDAVITGNIVSFELDQDLSNELEYEIIVPQGTFENIFNQQSRYIGSGEWSFSTLDVARYLTVNQSATSISEDGGQITFTILSNVAWSISESASWLSLSQTSGTGDAVAIATIDSNSGEVRSVDITFTGNLVPSVIKTITQDEVGETPLLMWTQIANTTDTVTPEVKTIDGTLSWDFGDGTPLIISNSPSHKYSVAGNYVIRAYKNGVDPLDLYSISLSKSLDQVNISGGLDLSQLTGLDGTNVDIPAGASCNVFLNGSLNLSNVIWPTQVISPDTFTISQTALTGIVDFSFISGEVNQLRFSQCASITGVVIPPISQVSLIDAVLCSSLISLDLSNVSISDFFGGGGGSIVSNACANLSSIILPTSLMPIWELQLQGCNLGMISLSTLPNMTNTDNGNYDFSFNHMTESEVDVILNDLDNMSTSGFTGRSIVIGGTNAAPSAAGLVDVASLEAKGFTVTHS